MLLAASLTGCQSIINKAKDVATKAAIEVADKRVNQLYDSAVEPQLAELESRIGEIDTSGDGTFSEEELAQAISAELTHQLGNLTSGEEVNWKTILTLGLLYILSKMGFKFGPKGVKGFRTWQSKRAAEPEVDLS